MKKRILSMLLAIVMVVSMVSGFAFAVSVEDFTDVEKDKWYYEYVEDVVKEGYFIGLNDTTFSPETPMNRGAMVVVLARLAGIDVDSDAANSVTTVFTDVPSGMWYTAAVKWAYDNNITEGVGNDLFMPREPVTREDACTFIIRYIDYMATRGYVTFDHLKTHKVFNFMDEANIRDYAAGAVDECMAYGIVCGTTGDETGYFYPRETWKRGEGAKMISVLADILENGRSIWIPTPPPAENEYTYSITYHATNDGVNWDVNFYQYTNTVKAATTPDPETHTVYYTATPGSYTVSGTTYSFVGWTNALNDAVNGVANDKYAKGNQIGLGANQPVTLYAVYKAVAVPSTFELVYSVDGKTDVIAPRTYEGIATEHTFDITDVATYTNGTVEYAILGWDTADTASTVVYEVGGEITVDANQSVTLYAVLVPMDDYIKMAVNAAIEDANDYIAKAEDLTVTAGSHDATVGTFLTADKDIELNVSTNTVNIAATGVLNVDTVIKVVEMATEYAVAILGPEDLPTVDEIKDIVIEAADSVDIDITDQTAREIAKQVYDKVDAIGTDLFSNFRNYNGGFCINKITLKSGNKAVASLNVTNDKGLTTDGADASKAAAKELAIAVAEAMCADLRTQSGSNITLKASIVVEFAPVYVSTYNDTYTLDLALTLKSDMYHYDGPTNTLTLIISEELQHQYAESVEDVMIAALENGTVQAKLTELIEKALEKSGLLDSLSSLAAKDAVDAAIDLWIAANLKAEAADPIDTPYEFLWTKEGTIISLVADEYATSTGTILGDNAALYTLVEGVYKDTLKKMINNIDASMITSAIGTADTAAVEAALDAWKTANTNENDPDSLFSFLYNGGKIIDNGDGTYTPASVGVNDELYELVEEIYADKLAEVINDVDASMVSGGMMDSIKSLLDPDDVDTAVNTALADWKTANLVNTDGDDDAFALYYFLYNGGKINADYSLSNITGKKLGVNDALYTMIIDLCEGEDGLAETVAETALTEAENQAGAYWGNMDDTTKLGLVAAGVKTELQNAGITGDFYNYLVNICLAEAAGILNLTDKEQEYTDAADSSCVAPMVDEMLIEGLYDATKDNEYVGLDQAGRADMVDEMLVEKLYNATKDNEYVGLDQAGREGMVDQMILKALATTTVKGKTLNEYLALAYHVKTIQRMATVELGVFADLLNNATFQNVAARYGNEYVHYLATAITKLPAKASVTIDGVVLSEAELEAVKAAAANNDTKAVCAELAKIVEKLGHLSMNEIEAEPLEITVKYGSHSVTVSFGLIIEDCNH